MSRIFTAFLILCLPLAASAADAVPAEKFDLDAFMSTYYQRPDPTRVPQAIDAFAADGLAFDASAASPVMTFFSLVFAANPERMKAWEADLKTKDAVSKAALEMAVFYSQNPDWVLQQPFHTATTNDMYWAAYYATGDSRYVQRVIDQLIYCDERTDVNLYLVGASAQWSLAGNLQEHPEVRGIMEKASQGATARIQQLLHEAVKQTPDELHAATIATLQAGKASGSWKPAVLWQYRVDDLHSIGKDNAGKPQYFVSRKVILYFLAEIGNHLVNYPPKFASEDEKIEVLGKLQDLLYTLDTLATDKADSDILLDAARANAMAYNVDVPGSGDEANAIFELLLKRNPNDVDANYGYGGFLGQTASDGAKAIPYLSKARELGVLDADFTLGNVYATLGDKDNAIKYLQRYAAEKPDRAADTQKFIDAIKSGNFKLIH